MCEPLAIAERRLIKDSLVGPFTSVGAGTMIEHSSVEYSVLMEDCDIYQVDHLIDSITGKGASLVGKQQGVRAIGLLLSHGTKTEL